MMNQMLEDPTLYQEPSMQMQAQPTIHPAMLLGMALMNKEKGGGMANAVSLMSNMQNQQTTAAYRNQLMKNYQYNLMQKQREQEAQQQISDLLANPENTPEYKKRLANALVQGGDTKSAMGLLGQSDYGQPIQVMGNDGKLKYVQVDSFGNQRELSGVSPIPKKGTSIITNPDGTFEFSQGGYDLQNGNVQPTTSTQGALQKDVTELDKQLNSLQQVAENYKSNYLTYGGEARAFLGSKVNKLFNNRYDAEFLKGRTKFVNSVEQNFNSYRKEITGAAAALAELDRLRQSFINSSQDPVSFEGAFEQYRDFAVRIRNAKAQALAEGIPLGSKAYGQRIDELVTSPQQSQPQMGGAMQQAPTQQQQAQPTQTATQPQVRRFNRQTGKFE